MFHTLMAISPRLQECVPGERDDRIAAVARRVREAMVQGPVAGPVCWEASAAVTEALVKAGYGAVQVQGHVVGEPVGLLLDYDLGHWWTEVDGLVVDATIDQLNVEGAAYPKVLVRPRADCPEYLSDAEWSAHLTAREWWCDRLHAEPPPAAQPEYARWTAFHTLLRTLPRTQWEVVRRIYYEELEWEEVEDELGLSDVAVSKRWRAAQKRVRKKLWAGSPPLVLAPVIAQVESLSGQHTPA